MIRLIRLPGGGFDIALDDTSDALGAVQTVVYALLYTDQRAPVAREADHFAARGWWADPEAGSGLWHVRRQGLSDAARAETVTMLTEVLSRAPALSSVSVSEVPATTGAAAGSVSRMQVRIEGQHNGQTFLMELSL